MILCFEGPSAIGKTKLSESFSDQYNIVPEVNLLFERDKTASKLWYYEKQIERYQLCQQSAKKAILDGDIFQPLWYNWIYGYPLELPTKEETFDFYSQKIENGLIRFPDLYIVFQVDENELRYRKEKDFSRTRRNFEKHLKLIEPQLEYFKFLKEDTEIDVEFVTFTDFTETRDKVSSIVQSKLVTKKRDEKVFKHLINWLI